MKAFFEAHKIVINVAGKMLFSLFILLCSFQTKAALNAQFAYSQSAVCIKANEGVIVTFTDQTTGGAHSSLWNFGEGSTSTIPNPSFTYTSPGVYYVNLTVTNSANETSAITKVIVIYRTPNVDFSSDKLFGCNPLTVKLTDKTNVFPITDTKTGTVYKDNIVSWSWDFGDATTSLTTVPNVSHTYTASGFKKVRLLIETALGCQSSFITANNFIEVFPELVAGFIISPPNSCQFPVTVTAANTSIGANAYKWTVSGPAGATIANPAAMDAIFTFTQPGSYTVSMDATNTQGCKNTYTYTYVVLPSPVTNKFSVVDSACENSSVSFLNQSNPAPTSNKWFVNGVQISTSFNLNYTFTGAGDYVVRLESKIGTCDTYSEKKIKILTAPTGDFNADSKSSCDFPFPVRFSALTSNDVVKRVWNFGDGNVLTETPPFKSDTQHIYSAAGDFNVGLVVENAKGCSLAKFKLSYINVQLPVIIKNNLPDSGCAPLTILPDVQFNINSSINKWEWYVINKKGDTITTYLGSDIPAQTFVDSGTYKIYLHISTLSGCDKLYMWPVKVGLTPKDFDFTAMPADTCANVVFQMNYSGDIGTGYNWVFSDGGKSNLINPSKRFSKLGLYDVTLTVFNNGCPKTLKKSQYLNVRGVVAKFTGLSDCSEPLVRQFTENSLGNIVRWDWDFGDGTSTRIVEKTTLVQHAYTSSGIYSVKLKVYGDGCEYEQQATVYVANEKAIDFNFSKQPICFSEGSVTIKSLADNYAMIKSYDWNFGCGFTGPDTTRNPILDFNKLCLYPANKGRGSYDMQLKVVDVNGCIYYSPLKSVLIGGPTADYTALSPLVGCQNLPVLFEDRGTRDGVNNIISRNWDFGDGTGLFNILSGPVEHVYKNAGVYPVTLTITDNIGCTATVNKLTVTTTNPIIDFAALQTQSCPGKTLQFEPTANTILASYTWDFGDGITSVLPNPRISYALASKKTVRLTARDVLGCEVTVVKPNYIDIDVPLATFNIPKDTSDCPPFNAEFYFVGNYADTYEWDFGDGGYSLQQNPKHIYSTAGVYPVSLKVTSPGGCVATSGIHNVVLRGPKGSSSFNNFTCKPFDVIFNVSSSTAKYVIIDYGNGFVEDSLPYQNTFTYRYSDTGFYQPKLFLENVEGCRVLLPINNGIRAVSVQTVFKSDLVFACDNANVKFTDLSLANEPLGSWLWNYGDGTKGTGNPSTHFYSKPGLYTVSLKSITQNGCADSLTRNQMIEIQARPDIGILSSKPQACEEDMVQFEGKEITPNNSAIVKWFWDFTNGSSADLRLPPQQLFRKAGTYPMRLYATNDKGCMDTVFLNYVINPLPPIDAGVDTFLCLNKPLKLIAKGAVNYVWSTDPTLSCTNCISPNVSTAIDKTYYVKGTSAAGCQATDSIKVKVVNPTSILASADVSICYGESVRLNASGTELYSWSPSIGLSDSTSTSPIAKPTQTTTYLVTGKDPYGCFVTTDNVKVTVNPLPTVNAGRDTTIMAGYPFLINPTYSTDVYRIQWEPSLFLSCTTCPTPVSTPLYSATYTVFAYTANGCMAKDVINVYATCTKENIFIPNTFSPNGDGMNEVFYPRGRGIQKIKAFRVFNRWGQLLFVKENFFANDISKGWNGTKDGSYVTPDVYVYMIDLVCENGNIITLKGDVTLVR